MTDGIAIIGLALLLSLNFIGIVVSAESSECSLFCVCDTWYELQRASCTNRHLYSVHTGAPDNVQALDLSDNVISALNPFELASVGFAGLKYLNLSGNAISEISLHAFHGLNDLTVLDLTKNRLYYVLDDVFVGNRNLRILKLSKNRFNSHVPKLQSSWLTELSLDSCQISHLPSDTFNGLPHIHRLDLSNNLMIQMRSDVVQPLHFLKKLSLQGNPWSCNTLLSDLQTHLKNNDIQSDDICGKTLHKFEKMILAPVKKPQNYHRSSTTNEESTKRIAKYNISHTLNNKNTLPSERTNQTITVTSMNRILPYWFLFIGFLFGIATGMVFSYIWLSGILTCRRCRRHESFNDSSQRLSLLLNPYFQDRLESDVNLAICPGTPPPPYRDVVLRPALYRSPTTVSNLSNDGYRGRCA